MKIGRIMIVRDPYKEPLNLMTEEHFQREGGTRFWKDRDEFIQCMGGPEAVPWVIEFKVIETLI
jgi:hypothetical protein